MTEVGYASDKPSDCAYCYFFSAGRKKGCPYGKHTPCLGYCIVKAMKEVKEHRNTG